MGRDVRQPSLLAVVIGRHLGLFEVRHIGLGVGLREAWQNVVQTLVQ